VRNHEPSQPPTVAIALMVALLLSMGFIGLVAVVLPGVLLMLLAGFGMLLFFVAQYFLWARWMFPIVQRWEREQNPESNDIPAATEE
jgi:hypothetical protein